MKYLAYALIVFVIWGLSGFAEKLLLGQLSSQTMAFITTASAAIGITVYTFCNGVSNRDMYSKYGVYAALLGGLHVVAIIAFYKALKNGPISVVIPFTSLYLIIPTILGFWLLKEQLTLSRALGIVLALFAGILLTR